MTDKIKPIQVPQLPRYVTGLKKDGTRDKRYTGGTFANLQRWMEEVVGEVEYDR